MSNSFLGAYWGPRKESARECARRASTFLEDLSTLSDDFIEWRLPGRSRTEAGRSPRLTSDLHHLETLFLKGVNRRDVGGESIDELGFRISVWNGAGDDHAASLTMRCGLYSEVPGVNNAVSLTIPSEFDLDSVAKVRRLLVSVIRAWQPDWAVVASSSGGRGNNKKNAPFLDRALYMSSSIKENYPEFLGLAGYEVAGGEIIFS
ncbi:hypothetical protein PCA31118_04300 [Pandoraea captiosa]|uniref:Immunity protein 52 domain-containing protein n=1 Tax=Pandoraea captiosa TaxID=2508302 RepID=A0A5E5AGK6_9BURK|nr:hypothetical protein PCA31118_04300 [Pandoraea captiosa]